MNACGQTATGWNCQFFSHHKQLISICGQMGWRLNSILWDLCTTLWVREIWTGSAQQLTHGHSREMDKSVFSNHHLLNEFAVTQLHQLRVVKGRCDLPPCRKKGCSIKNIIWKKLAMCYVCNTVRYSSVKNQVYKVPPSNSNEDSQPECLAV